MKSFKDYLLETELMEHNPAVGDVFELEIAREEFVIETTVIDVVADGVVIEADDTMLNYLTALVIYWKIQTCLLLEIVPVPYTVVTIEILTKLNITDVTFR